MINKTLSFYAGRIAIKLLNFFCGFFPLKNEIVFESHPDLSCNTFELYRYILQNNSLEKYKIVWLVENPKLHEPTDRVEFIPIYPSGLVNIVRTYMRCNRAKIVVCCNRHIQKYKVSKKQINIYILHGSPLKDCQKNYTEFKCDYIISQSDFFKDSIKKMFNVKDEQVISLGFPRNDQLNKSYNSLKFLIPEIDEYNKVICWVPTFRSHMNGKRVDCHSNFPLGVPILYSKEMVEGLNKFLIERNVLIILKPHPAQDLSIIKGLDCSNIKLLYNCDLAKFNIQTNEFLAQTDAMLGDYSGIYYDYLLLDKPIGITLDDYSQYCQENGMVFENPLDVLKGFYINNLDELERFINMTVMGRDEGKKDRDKIKQLTNCYPYFNSSERACKFIEKKVAERFGNT